MQVVELPERDTSKPLRVPISGIYKIKGVGDVLAGRVEHDGPLEDHERWPVPEVERVGQLADVDHRPESEDSAEDRRVQPEEQVLTRLAAGSDGA